MADQAAAGPATTVAAPAPTKQPPGPAGHVSETEFWANDAAPAIGGRYGIPNGMMSAAAAVGSPDDVGALFGRLDGRRGRGLALVRDPSEVNKRIVNVIRNAYEVPWGAANPAAATNPYAASIGFDETSAAKLLDEIVQGLSQW